MVYLGKSYLRLYQIELALSACDDLSEHLITRARRSIARKGVKRGGQALRGKLRPLPPAETDCVAGHVRLELRNVDANYLHARRRAALGALRDWTGCGVRYIEPIKGKTK
jgi:hypothetical protein